MAQKFRKFSTLRRGKGAAEPGAFQCCGGGSEPQRLPQILFLGDGQRERAMEHVAGAQRIHGVDREGRRLLQIALLVEPDRPFRPAGPGQERRRQLCDLFKCLAVIGDICRLLQRFA